MKFFSALHTFTVMVLLLAGIAAVVIFNSAVFCKIAGILK